MSDIGTPSEEKFLVVVKDINTNKNVHEYIVKRSNVLTVVMHLNEYITVHRHYNYDIEIKDL